MILIYGLGNQGKEYRKTRHNFGRIVAQSLLEKDLFNSKVIIKTNEGFMNNCGIGLVKFVNYYKINPENILVVHDDMDIEFGDVKLDYNRSSAGHHGVESIIDNLKTQEFYRLRLGIGKSQTIAGDKYVLEKFLPTELESITKIIDKAVDLLVKSDLLKYKLK